MSPGSSELSSEVTSVLDRAVTLQDSMNYVIDGVEPLAVVRPSGEEELREVLAAANRDGVAVYPRGGGTRIQLGGVPSRPGIVVDTTRINRVVAHNAGDLTASFQAGATFQLVTEVLAQEGQLLAIDPPLPTAATVGGTLAAGVSGPLKWHYGHPRDTVIGMKVVQPDGVVTKSGGQVVKNVSGYDMSRLHIGGLGSLGIILEASFKLTPLPMYEKTILAEFETPEEAISASMAVFNSHVMPLAATVFDDAAGRRLSLDDLQNTLCLAVRLGGRPRALDRQVDELIATCRNSGARSVETTEGRAAASLWRGLADFGWSLGNAADLNMRIAVLPNQTIDVINAVRQHKTEHLQPAVSAQPAFGTIEANWFADDNSSADTNRFSDIVSGVRRVVSELGGTAVVQRCPVGLKHVVDVWGGEPPGMSVMRELKAQYDPNNILNPGRFVGGI